MDKYKEYLQLATADIKTAKIILNTGNDELMQNISAYHTQQAVEKIMKGPLVNAGSYAGISHNITELSKDLDEIGVTYPEWIHDKDDEISSWATTIRYNANFKSDHDEIQSIINLVDIWLDELNET